MDSEEAANKEKVASIYEVGQDAGKIVFDQMMKQGVNAALATIIGIEVAALGLENPDIPAGREARIGSLCMLAHRIIDGKFPDPRAHIVGGCSICMKVGSLE